MPQDRCDVCNSILFVAEPFKTTQQEILEFARHSSLQKHQKQDIIRSRWIHPGYYCPNGCTKIFDDGPIPLPSMMLEESMAIATKYAQTHFPEFLQTHGPTSRILCCTFCRNFRGARLEGENPSSNYHQPRFRPFRYKRIISAECSDPRINELKTNWWYSKGRTQAECEYFEQWIPLNGSIKM
jgi:hypothetical protein